MHVRARRGGGGRGRGREAYNDLWTLVRENFSLLLMVEYEKQITKLITINFIPLSWPEPLMQDVET